MTEEQIIKALEYCFTRGFDESTCYECPFYTATAKCTEDLRESVLDLINRQKAEIERLKRDIAIHEHVHEESNAAYQVHVKQAKSEAIKEFAERLKEKLCCEDDCGYHCFDCCYECKDYVPVVDKLVKEMTEEKSYV